MPRLAAAAGAGGFALGVRRIFNVYCPGGTARNVNWPFALVVAVALSKPDSCAGASAPPGTSLRVVFPSEPSGPEIVPETRTIDAAVNCKSMLGRSSAAPTAIETACAALVALGATV